MLAEAKTAIIKFSTNNSGEKTKETSGPFYPQLNGLRFVFIFMVLIHHWGPQTLFEHYRIGWVGVDLFFVLSGFLIGEILLREKEHTTNKLGSVKNFVIRRALRIFPLYYVTIILYSVFVNDGGILIYNLTYTNNIFQAFNLEKVQEEFWHIWSLCVEEQFYLFFPFLIFFVNRRRLPLILIAGIVLSFAGRFFTKAFTSVQDPHILMPFSLDSLFLGALLAYLKLYRADFLMSVLRNKVRVAVTITGCFIALFLLCRSNNQLMIFGLLRVFGSVAGFFLIGYSVMIGYKGALKRFFENRLVSLFGKISYGIYLVHPFIERIYYTHANENVVRNFFISLHKPIVSNRYVIDFISLFLLTVAISYLSFHFLEKRFLKLKRLYS